MYLAFMTALLSAAVLSATELEKARDAQDRTALDRAVKDLSAAADKQPNDASSQYRLAQASSYLAEVAIEQRDKNTARSAAETGIRAAEKSVSLKPDNAEYHRLLGTLCGQAVRDVMSGMKYGRCALDEVNKAIQLDPKSAQNYLSRGVGYYYLPSAFGGGVERAIPDFQKAIELNPKLADAQLWLGVALRKANKNAEARKAFERSLQLNPNRVWAKQQLEKTPAN